MQKHPHLLFASSHPPFPENPPYSLVSSAPSLSQATPAPALNLPFVSSVSTSKRAGSGGGAAGSEGGDAGSGDGEAESGGGDAGSVRIRWRQGHRAMSLATSLYHLLATPWSSHPIAGRSTSPRNRHAVPPRHGLRIPLRRAPPVCGLCSLPQADPATDLGFDLGFGIWDCGCV